MAYTVSEFMTRELVTVTPDDPLRSAVETMQARNCRRLPVLENERLVGIISDRDVRLALMSPLVLRERWYDEALLDNTPVRACMTTEVRTVASDTPLIQAAAPAADARSQDRRTARRGRRTTGGHHHRDRRAGCVDSLVEANGCG